MGEPDGEERTRRARAAWGYSLESNDALASAAGINPDTLRSYLEKGKAPPPMSMLYKVVRAAGIHESFAEVGFVMADPAITALARRVARLEARLAELEATQPAVAAPPKKPSQRKPPLGTTAKKRADRSKTRTPKAGDAPTGTGQ